MLTHPIAPVCRPDAKVLILGSFPSVRSREAGFFYGHPQNRFWRVLAALFDCALPQTVEEKTAMLTRHHVALWDVIASCEITGSSDSSIKNVQPNDLQALLAGSRIRAIFCNGQTAYKLFCHYQAKTLGLAATPLPSTSPANAAFGLSRLCESWRVILDALQEGDMQLRAYQSADCAQLARLFYDTVHTVNAADYTPAQLDAWATGTVDLAAWDASFLEHHTLVAVRGGTIAGFADMDRGGYLDRLYVRKDFQRQRVATALCDALEAASGAPRFTTHASITAKPFFLRRGYRVLAEQQVERRGVLLTNFRMEKENPAK